MFYIYKESMAYEFITNIKHLKVKTAYRKFGQHLTCNSNIIVEN